MHNLKDGRDSTQSKRLLAIISRRRVNQEKDILNNNGSADKDDFLSPLAQIKKVTSDLKQETEAKQQLMQAMGGDKRKELDSKQIDHNREKVMKLVGKLDTKFDLLKPFGIPQKIKMPVDPKKKNRVRTASTKQSQRRNISITLETATAHTLAKVDDIITQSYYRDMVGKDQRQQLLSSKHIDQLQLKHQNNTLLSKTQCILNQPQSPIFLQRSNMSQYALQTKFEERVNKTLSGELQINKITSSMRGLIYHSGLGVVQPTLQIEDAEDDFEQQNTRRPFTANNDDLGFQQHKVLLNVPSQSDLQSPLSAIKKLGTIPERSRASNSQQAQLRFKRNFRQIQTTQASPPRQSDLDDVMSLQSNKLTSQKVFNLNDPSQRTLSPKKPLKKASPVKMFTQIEQFQSQPIYFSTIVKEAEQTLTKEEILEIFQSKIKDLDIKLPGFEDDLDELQMYEMFKKHAQRRCINRKINLHDQGLGIKFATTFAKIIENHTKDGLQKFSSLNLGKNLLKDQGVKIILDQIRKSQLPIVFLDFSNNELSHNGVQHITSNLMKGLGESVVHLCIQNNGALQKNRIGQIGGKIIAEFLQQSPMKPELFKLQVLHLKGTALTSKGAEHILHAYSNVMSSIYIEDLDISNNEIVFSHHHMPSLCNILSNQNSPLRTISIANNQLGDELCQKLSMSLSIKHNQLRSLNLSGCNLTILSLSYLFRELQNNKVLKKLQINDNNFQYPNEQDKELLLEFSHKQIADIKTYVESFFRHNTALDELQINSSNINDELLNIMSYGLVVNSTLKKLSLSRNQLSDDSMVQLFKNLNHDDTQSILFELDISSNHLKDKSAFHLANLLKNEDCSLISIDISNNSITSAGVSELFSTIIGVQRVENLNVMMNLGIPHQLIVAVQNCLERNRHSKKKHQLPYMLGKRAYLQGNLQQWRNQFVDVSETIFRTKIEERVLVRYNTELKSKLDQYQTLSPEERIPQSELQLHQELANSKQTLIQCEQTLKELHQDQLKLESHSNLRLRMVERDTEKMRTELVDIDQQIKEGKHQIKIRQEKGKDQTRELFDELRKIKEKLQIAEKVYNKQKNDMPKPKK